MSSLIFQNPLLAHCSKAAKGERNEEPRSEIGSLGYSTSGFVNLMIACYSFSWCPRKRLNEAEQQVLVSKLTAHYKEFYTVKWTAAHEDVLAFYCSVWLSKLGTTHSWLTGWKPSIIFRIVESMRTGVPGPGLAELTEVHIRKIKQLRMKIKLEEEKMERQQTAMADRKMVELVGMASRIRNGELVGQVDGLVEVALKGILAGLEKVVKAVDCMRLKILKNVGCFEPVAICGLSGWDLRASDSAEAMRPKKGYPKSSEIRTTQQCSLLRKVNEILKMHIHCLVSHQALQE